MQIQPPGEEFTLKYILAWDPSINRAELPPHIRQEIDERIQFCLWTLHACVEAGQSPDEPITISVWKINRDNPDPSPGYIPVVEYGRSTELWGVIVYYSDDEIGNEVYRNQFGDLDHWI